MSAIFYKLQMNRTFIIGGCTLLFIALLCLFSAKFSNPLSNLFHARQQPEALDTLEFAPASALINASALNQLSDFPAAQFKADHHLLPNFLWMDPAYLAGLLQPKYKTTDCVKRSIRLQAELATNWHYYFLVNTNLKAYKTYRDSNTFTGAWVRYANLHPELPVAAISFWAQIQPSLPQLRA